MLGIRGERAHPLTALAILVTLITFHPAFFTTAILLILLLVPFGEPLHALKSAGSAPRDILTMFVPLLSLATIASIFGADFSSGYFANLTQFLLAAIQVHATQIVHMHLANPPITHFTYVAFCAYLVLGEAGGFESILERLVGVLLGSQTIQYGDLPLDIPPSVSCAITGLSSRAWLVLGAGA